MEGSSEPKTELAGLLATLSHADLCQVEVNGSSLIHELVRRRDHELLSRALKRHAGVNATAGELQRSVLHIIVSGELNGRSGGRGVTTRARKRMPRAFPGDEMGFPDGGSDMQLIEMVLNYGGNPNQQDSAGDTPLHLALQNNDLHSALILVNNMADLHVENAAGEKCLAFAGDDASVLEEAVSTRMDRLHKLLDAAESGEVRKTQAMLQQGLLANACDEDGMTALHFAVRQNHVEVVRELLKCNGDPNHAHAGGKTPFHFACEEVAPQELAARISIVELFIAACGPDIDIPDMNGDGPLHLACVNNMLEIVSLLTDAGASKDLLNSNGLRPYQCLGCDEAEIETVLTTAREAVAIANGATPKPNQLQVDACIKKLIALGFEEKAAKKAQEECGSTDVADCLGLLNKNDPPKIVRKKSADLPRLQRKKSAPKMQPVAKKRKSTNSDSDSDTWSGSEDDEVYVYSSGDEDDAEGEDMMMSDDEPQLIEAKWMSKRVGDILTERDTLIADVCETTFLNETDAAEMLHQYKWSKDSCVQAFFASGEESLISIGVLRTEGDPPAIPKSIQCSVYASEKCMAYGEEPAGDVQDQYSCLQCGHCICNHCWGELLTQKVTDNEIHPLRCLLCTIPSAAQAAAKTIVPGHVVPEKLIEKLVSADTFKRYRYLLGKSYVESNNCIKWCPSPDCAFVVNGSLMTHRFGDQPTVTCGGSHQFCFDCSREPHNPATCQMVKDWEVRNADQGGDETMIWVQLHSAPCPKCGIAIQKNQGCNHMTCRAPVGCGFDFCWVCKEKWGTCDYYSCNKFKKGEPKPDESDADAKLKEKANMLEKYLFYWKRYKAQDLTDKFQGELEAKLKMTIDSIREESTDPTALSLCEKINEGLGQLIECRMALKWSFVRAFSLGDTTEQEMIDKDLFEQWLGQLAGVCDRLMMELEKPPEEMSLAVLSDQLAIAKKNFANLDTSTF